jgi:P2X purinoceptor 7
LVEQLDEAVVRRLALELLRRQPAAFADLVDGEFANTDDQDPEEPNPPPQDSPDWCFCGNCAPMPTQEENKCCCRRVMPCITSTPLFSQLVLDGNVLDIAMRYREDIIVADPVRNNENFRHAAYRQFVLWQHGRLGKGNRVVVPSCCVLKIRARYPSPNGLYVGFRPARL